MPYVTPTLTDLISLALADINNSELEGADGLLPISNLVIMAMLQARLSYDHYGYLARVALNSTPFKAQAEWLDAWANLIGVYRKDATAAGTSPAAPGTATFTGTAGTDCPAGTQLSRGDGFTYASIADATVADNDTLTISFAATSPGASGNASAGIQLTISNPIAGINSAGQSTSLITGGADQEIDDDLRTRMFAAYQARVAGGTAADYRGWALAVAGVTRAWCSPIGNGPGTVVVYTMFDNANAAEGGFPQGSNGVASLESEDAPATGDQLTVANAIYGTTGPTGPRPVTALVYSCAPIAQPVPFTFAVLSPNTAPIKVAIQTAITGMLLRKASPLGMTLVQSDWISAIEAVPGLEEFAVSVPAVSVSSSLGYLLTLGTITWPS